MQHGSGLVLVSRSSLLTAAWALCGATSHSWLRCRNTHNRTTLVTDQPSRSDWLFAKAQTFRRLASRAKDAGLSTTLEQLADEFDRAAWDAMPDEEAHLQLLC